MPGFVMAQVDSLPPHNLSLDSLLQMRISSVSKYEQTTADAPASVSIIAKEDILSFGYGNLAELLNAVRDLYLSDDRNYGYLGIRGFGQPTDYNNRVAILVNGVLLNENIWGSGPVGSEFWGLNIDDVERVEVIRGPASALYGTSPVLGMINVVTQTGKALDGAKASVEQGSFGKWQGSAAVGKALRSGLDFNVGLRAGRIGGQQLYYAEYDDSSTNFGVADRRDGSQYYGINGLASYRHMTVKLMQTWREIGVPTGSFGALFNDPRNKTRDSYGLLDLSYDRDLSTKLSFFGRASFNHYRYLGDLAYDSLDGGIEEEATRTARGTVEARLCWDITSDNRLLVGGEYNQHFLAQYKIGDTRGVLVDQNYPFHTFGVYLQDEYQPLERLVIITGFRYDRLYLGRNAITPRVSIHFEPFKNATIKGLYGVAFRAPSIYELNIGYVGSLLPNPRLRSELVQSGELVWEQQFSKRYNGAVSLFTNRLINLVEQVDLGNTFFQFRNKTSAGGYGASAEFNGRLENGLHFYMNYGFAFIRDLEDKTWLLNSPRHVAKGGISIPLPAYLSLAPEVVGQTGRLTTIDTKTQPFLLANVNLLFAPQLEGKSMLNRIQLSFKVRNLLNADYRYPGGLEHLQPAIQQNGINYNLKLQVDLF
jgi:outer membrane receptor for ferrienterochelin and colicins